MMFTKKGIWFNYEGDKVCLIWFWHKDIGRYYSDKYNRTFYTFSEYLKHIGFTESPCKSNNILGFDYQEVILTWVTSRFKREVIVVLFNIDILKKPINFWENIPYHKRVLFNKDLIVLFCKDLGQVKQIVDSVDISFADAYGFKAGKLVYWNNDN